jgi:hypothetical protein
MVYYTLNCKPAIENRVTCFLLAIYASFLKCTSVTKFLDLSLERFVTSANMFTSDRRLPSFLILIS